ncbi:cyanophycinase [Algimonas porphyrae]|uniref:Cyanophycinase n=1 Tax=Algimonas porphyrae TaxID=1128113 RepID=A0ABQ5V2Q4_9PROT|nr:cyanophycinase [Algimonas porphyrae]GLQ21357.1 cyanophycinase [Algimonas porphyrae]
MCPAKVSDHAERGYIIPIGGGERKVHTSAILTRFIKLCGGSKARIAIIPTASRLVDTGDRYRDVFEEIGVASADIVTLDERSDCEDMIKLATLEKATGIFMTGGDQLRLATIIGGTSVARLMRRANAEGIHIAGTSAGAAFIPEHMIAFGRGGATPKGGLATLAPGLGLTNKVIIDQHFRERGRLGRLLSALSYNPFGIGLGVDEDTAAFIGPDDVIEIVGSGGITVIDPTGLEHSSMADVSRGKPVCLIGIRLHILLDGGRFDLSTREASPSSG